MCLLSRFVHIDIKFTRPGFKNTCWIPRQVSRWQLAFSKPCLVNLISKDTHLVFSIQYIFLGIKGPCMGTNHMSYILSVIDILQIFYFLHFKPNCKKIEVILFPPFTIIGVCSLICLCAMWYLIVSILHLCTLTYFGNLYCKQYGPRLDSFLRIHSIYFWCPFEYMQRTYCSRHVGQKWLAR